MAISERINPDNLNIHQFQEVPEVSPELPFDPEKDLPDDFKKKTIIEELKKTDNVLFYCEILEDARLLWPNENFDDGHISDEKLLKIVRGNIDNWENGQSGILGVFQNAITVVTARPSLNIDSVKSKLLSIAEQYIASVGGSNPADTTILSLIKRLDPSIKLNVKEAELKAWEKNLENFSQAITAYDIQELRYIDPDYHPKLTNEQWDILYNTLPQYGIPLAVAMKVLSAYKVEVTAPGVIDIQMYPPQDVNTSTPPMPETRKF